MPAQTVILTALANVFLTGVLIAVAARSRRTAWVFAIGVAVVLTGTLLVPGSFALGHSFPGLLGAAVLITAITWLPGAALALTAGVLRNRARRIAAALALAAAGLFGGLFVLTGVSVACMVLGDCL